MLQENAEFSHNPAGGECLMYLCAMRRLATICVRSTRGHAITSSYRSHRILHPASPRPLPPLFTYSSDHVDPPAPVQSLLHAADRRCARSSLPIFTAGVGGSVLLSISGMMMGVCASGVLSSGGSTELATLAGAFLCPAGLVMVVFTGTDLLTSNFMYGALPLLRNRNDRERRDEAESTTPPHATASNSGLGGNYLCLLGWSAAGNMAGSMAMAYLASCMYMGTPVGGFVAALALKKCSLPVVAAVMKGIGANALVNIGIYMAACSRSSIGKIGAIWIPITCFVALGLEHSVANAFLLPLGMWSGAEISLSSIFLDNLIPVATGNMVGGVLVGSVALRLHGPMPDAAHSAPERQREVARIGRARSTLDKQIQGKSTLDLPLKI